MNCSENKLKNYTQPTRGGGEVLGVKNSKLPRKSIHFCNPPVGSFRGQNNLNHQVLNNISGMQLS